MQANIFEIKRFAVHDGDGIRTTVFFKGCPLRCRWCHNPEGLAAIKNLAFYAHLCTHCGNCAKACAAGVHEVSADTHSLHRDACTFCGDCLSACPQKALRIYGRTVTIDELMPTLLADRPFFEESGGGITLSGGECLLQADFCTALLKALKDEGINTAVDTSGAVPPQSIQKVLPHTDRFLYDIKHFDPQKHKDGTGMDNHQILANLEMLFQANASVEIRIPLIPGYNDDCIEQVAQFLSQRPSLHGVRVLRYHNFAASKYSALDMPNTLPPLSDDDGVAKAKAILASHGINFIQ